MPFLPDVNVVLAARRTDHPAHAVALSWLESALAGDDHLVVPHVVWSGFLRLATSARVWEDPDSAEDAWTFVEAIRAAEVVRDLPAGEAVLTRFARMCRESGATGNLVPDVYLAACAGDVGATVVTFDRDFRRLDDVRLLELGI